MALLGAGGVALLLVLLAARREYSTGRPGFFAGVYQEALSRSLPEAAHCPETAPSTLCAAGPVTVSDRAACAGQRASPPKLITICAAICVNPVSWNLLELNRLATSSQSGPPRK